MRRIIINKADAPPIAIDTFLPGAGFTDAYSVHAAEPLDALEAARRMMERPPRWVGGLLMLRNLAVTPFGLKREAPVGSERIGIFLVVSASPELVVMGFDDAHLDFRVVVEVTPSGGGQQVTATTFVRTRNRLGQLYLAALKPFHRLIVALLHEWAIWRPKLEGIRGLRPPDFGPLPCRLKPMPLAATISPSSGAE